MTLKLKNVAPPSHTPIQILVLPNNTDNEKMQAESILCKQSQFFLKSYSAHEVKVHYCNFILHSWLIIKRHLVNFQHFRIGICQRIFAEKETGYQNQYPV